MLFHIQSHNFCCNLLEVTQAMNSSVDFGATEIMINIISDNEYFKIGLEYLVGKPSIARSLSLYIKNNIEEKNVQYYLIDVPSNKFRFFLNKQWMAKFPSNSVIILFPDKRMEPLANYWLFHSSLNIEIRAVVCNSDTSITSDCIEHALSGKLMHPGRQVKLTECEFMTLKYLAYDGICIQKIASISQKNTKTIYVFKRNIESKLNSSIKSLLL